ncbi:MAG: PQQ-binding-like beta-propeller repeat protein [Streptosporangiaceae bacterium]|jgi:outer membrane protein assembly factor BamB
MSRHGSVARVLTAVAALGLAGGSLLVPTAAAGASPAAGPTLDWSQYLHGPQHSSVSLATAFTPSNAASATEAWHWQPPAVTGDPAPVLDASPTVVAGRVYIGAQSGGFYALNEATGAVTWSRQLDTEPKATCPARGISSTAAVLPDPVTGVSTVYVSGARYLYALNASTGAVAWKTEIGPASTPGPDAYYNWSSPMVAGGHVYVGLSSSCDDPLIRGGVVELDQHTGQVLHTWYTVPAGSIGGSVWSSVAGSSDGSDLWVSTGNECDPTVDSCPPGNQIGNSLSIVHLSSSLGLLQAWQAPGTAGHGHDWDFGSSPTLFGSGGTPPDVGACNKDGKYYALAANPLGSSALWIRAIGAPAGSLSSCLASAVWDGQTGALYVGGDGTTIGPTRYGGSVRRVNPANGAYIWQTGLPCAIMGTPTLDSAGVLAAGTYSCAGATTPGAYLINASTGAILKTLPVGSGRVFGQPVFAQGTLFVATEGNGLYDFAP